MSKVEHEKGGDRINHINEGNVCPYKLLSQVTPLCAIQGYTIDGKIFFWNSASTALYEYSENEVMGRDIKEILLPPEEWNGFDNVINRIIHIGKPTEPQQWIVKTKTGKIKYVFSTMVPIKEENRLSIFCMDVDITKQIEIQLRLAESEQNYRNLIESAHEGIWVVDEEFRTVYVNKKMCEIMGYTADELIGRTTLDFVPPEEHADVYARRESRRKGIREQYERTLIGKNGERRVCLVNAGPIYDAKNNFKGAVGLFADITERKAVEELIRLERDKLRQYFNLSPSLFIVLDTNGNIIYLNNSVKTILQCDDQIYGKNWFETFVAPEIRSTWKEHFYSSLKHQELHDSTEEVHIITLSGEERVFSLRNALLHDPQGRVEGIIYAGMDVTEKIREEKERELLEERIKLIQRLESVGMLAGGIAHDFHNLLVGIIGNADLALMDLPQDSHIRTYLEEIIKISKRLTNLSQQLLAYAGKGKQIIRQVSLNEIIKNLESLIEIPVSKKVIIKQDLEDNLPPIQADPSYIQQLILNLVMNASEAIGDKPGVITLVTRHMHCDRKYLDSTLLGGQCKEGEYVYLEVLDTGCGIPPDVMERMFEPFFTTKFLGRGLGLPAVLGIVKAHNGTIKVYTELGKGTSFKVFFPVIPNRNINKADTSQSSSSPLPIGSQEKYILVADDDPIVRNTVKNMIELAGYKVITASHGEETIKIYSTLKNQISLVLLDLTMPVMDGEETFRELRRINPSVKVILSSGYHEKDVLERFVGKGLAGFIQKPYVLTSLHKLIQDILGK